MPLERHGCCLIWVTVFFFFFWGVGGRGQQGKKGGKDQHENIFKLWKYTFVQVVVDPPLGNEPVGLDMIHMGKGLAWLNGEEIGRYWPIKSSIHEECVKECDYRGKFLPNKCRTGCGEPTQRW